MNIADNGVPAVHIDAAKILDNLVHELGLPKEVADLRSNVSFDGGEPFLPLPHKNQAASSALHGLLAIAAARILQLRGATKVPQIFINTDHASLYLAGFAMSTLDGHPVSSPSYLSLIPNVNEEETTLLRQEIMNVYKTKDGRFFHTHCSLNASSMLKLIGLDPNLVVKDIEEAREVIGKECLKYTAEELRMLCHSNGMVGEIVLQPAEFDNSDHGKIINSLPLARFIDIESSNPGPSPLTGLPSTNSRPLEGIRVVELTRVIAGSVGGRLLAELGADVVRVIGPDLPDFSIFQPDYNLNKRPVHIDLRSKKGQEQMGHLLASADIFLQGYRPGAMNRLGLSHERLAELGNKRGKPYIIVDEACYGGEAENAPWSLRPGYQQIADGLSGVAWETGVASGLDEPVIPCLPISDYCAGTLCTVMAVLGLVRRAEPGKFGVKGNSFFSPISLTALDVWLRRQGQYPISYVREKHALHGFRYNTGLGPMLFKTLQVKLAQDPLYNQPGFYNVIEHAPFEGRARVTGQPRREEGGKGVKYICLGPVIKFDGIDTSYISTAPWGYFRPGWSEADADALEEALEEVP